MSTPAAPSDRPAAVLWDLDGLLVDSEPLWFEAEKQVTARLGGTWSTEQQEKLIGSPIERTVSVLLENAGSDVDQAVVQQWVLEAMVAAIESGLSVQPGAAALLEALDAAGVPSVLVSSSYRVIVDAALARIAPLDRFFMHTVAGDEVSARKPDPAPYLRAAQLLDVDIADCIVLEDSLTGARAGAAAGARVMVVPSVVDVPMQPGWSRFATLADIDLPSLAAPATQL